MMRVSNFFFPSFCDESKKNWDLTRDFLSSFACMFMCCICSLGGANWWWRQRVIVKPGCLCLKFYSTTFVIGKIPSDRGFLVAQ